MASNDSKTKLDTAVKHCVVCGAGSHREDWQKVAGPVACDSHSKEEVEAAAKKAAPPADPKVVHPGVIAGVKSSEPAKK